MNILVTYMFSGKLFSAVTIIKELFPYSILIHNFPINLMYCKYPIEILVT